MIVCLFLYSLLPDFGE